MPSKRLTMWLLVGALLACAGGVLLQSPTRHCMATTSILCNQRGIMNDLAMMAVPPLVLLARGGFAAWSQMRRTALVVRTILRLPQAALPPALTVLVRRLDLDGRVRLIDAARPEAFCYGFARPRICLSTGLLAALAPDEVEAVLRHERHHLRRHDPLRTVAWTFLSNMLPWLEDHALHAHLLRELDADRAVLVTQGRRPLASALMKLVGHNTSTRSTHGLALSGLSVTDARIDQLLHPQQPQLPKQRMLPWLMLPVVLLLALLVCSTIMARIWA